MESATFLRDANADKILGHRVNVAIVELHGLPDQLQISVCYNLGGSARGHRLGSSYDCCRGP